MENVILDDDRPTAISSMSPTCSFCSRLQDPFNRRCTAFENIPMQIWSGKIKHTQPYKGDNGFIFKRITDEELNEHLIEARKDLK